MTLLDEISRIRKLVDADIEVMQQHVRQVNEQNGWFDLDRTFGDDIALLHSEVSEAFEEYRDFEVQDTTKLKCINKLADKLNIPTENAAKQHNLNPHICKPEGVGSELADVLVRLLDTCERYDIDLTAEFWRKLEYNATRSHRHGNKRV